MSNRRPGPMPPVTTFFVLVKSPMALMVGGVSVRMMLTKELLPVPMTSNLPGS